MLAAHLLNPLNCDRPLSICAFYRDYYFIATNAGTNNEVNFTVLSRAWVSEHR